LARSGRCEDSASFISVMVSAVMFMAHVLS
jgi:hypothetical protein